MKASFVHNAAQLVVCFLLISGFLTAGCETTHTTIAVIDADGGKGKGNSLAEPSSASDPIPVDPVEGPGPEPGIECQLPEMECPGDESFCGELIQFLPPVGIGYVDYPENGESETLQERSYYRRDLVQLVKYAAAYVACKTVHWDFGNGGPIGVMDGSTEQGENPGGYWDGTHLDGHDLTVAYYQVNTDDNRVRAVCEHKQNGTDMSRCLGDPVWLDPFRTALFVGIVSNHPSVRVIGCDGKVGPKVQDALVKLCQNGWIEGTACHSSKLTWEETDTGLGWYYSHHHHMQISINSLD